MAITPNSIFQSAQQFQALEMLAINHAMKNNAAHLFVPAMVTGALAFELYLKCLILSDTGQLARTQHNYWQLFFKLKPTTQTEVKNWYDRLPPSPEEVAAPHDEDLKRAKFSYSFEAVLKRSQNAVVEWRYLYEGQKLDAEGNKISHSSAPTRIRNAVIQVIRDLHPNWPIRANCIPPTFPVP